MSKATRIVGRKRRRAAKWDKAILVWSLAVAGGVAIGACSPSAGGPGGGASGGSSGSGGSGSGGAESCPGAQHYCTTAVWFECYNDPLFAYCVHGKWQCDPGLSVISSSPGCSGSGGFGNGSGGFGSGGASGGSAGIGGAGGGDVSADGTGGGSAGTTGGEGGGPSGGRAGAAGGAGGSNGKRAFACYGGGAAGAAGECRTGQTFCHIQVLRSASATASCESFTDTSRTADCSVNPTCDCLCTNALFFHCHTECACSETDGQVTVTCSQISASVGSRAPRCPPCERWTSPSFPPRARRLPHSPLRPPPPKTKKARDDLAFRSGRRDLNPRRPPWQGGTLPLSYSRGISRAGCLDEEGPGVNIGLTKLETFRRGRAGWPSAPPGRPVGGVSRPG